MDTFDTHTLSQKRWILFLAVVWFVFSAGTDIYLRLHPVWDLLIKIIFAFAAYLVYDRFLCVRTSLHFDGTRMVVTVLKTGHTTEISDLTCSDFQLIPLSEKKNTCRLVFRSGQYRFPCVAHYRELEEYVRTHYPRG